MYSLRLSSTLAALGGSDTRPRDLVVRHYAFAQVVRHSTIVFGGFDFILLYNFSAAKPLDLKSVDCRLSTND